MNNYYCEIDGLFVEYEFGEHPVMPSYCTEIVIINVQLPHPDDPEDTGKWIDLTDHLGSNAKAQIVEQIDEELRDRASARGCDGY